MTTAWVISDLDGTLIDLRVDWDQLRRGLGVRSIGDLWSSDDLGAWDDVSDAEAAAAAVSPINEDLVAELRSVRGVAVLSNNSVRAVEETVRRIGGPAKDWTVIGRELLGSPKEDQSTFDLTVARLMRCWSATPEDVWYLGDAAYEIEYARALGMQTWHLDDRIASPIPEGFLCS